jgi:ABC-type multidrug transport system ATPase subunit
MIQLQQVNVELDEKHVLHSIDLKWRQGESIVLAGANGAGKSTLLKVLSTLLKPASGKMILPKEKGIRQWRQSIGTVFPETFLYDALTAIENLDFYAQLYNVRNINVIEEMLDKVGLFQLRHEPVRAFSKGMRQRLSIARALVHQPDYLLLDEPFDGLDAKSTEQIEQLLWHLKSSGVGWILVSHDLFQARRLCERAVLLHQGRIYLSTACNEDAYTKFLEDYRRILKETSDVIS